MNKKTQIKEIICIFSKKYPNPECALTHKTPWELLVATILSAQCTDKRVNMVTPDLFKKFPTAEETANASIEELEELIKSTGFYHNKAKNIKACAEKLVKEYNGTIPQNIDEMVKLPGVGRKTANVVLGNAFGIASGIVVDTHVSRISQKLGLTKEKDPVKIENDLKKIVPQKYWVSFSHWLVFHGRERCIARRPQCVDCELEKICPKLDYNKIGEKNE